MRLKSPVFNNNEFLPAEFTCDGPNVNPPLVISEAPDEAASLSLVVVDLDAIMDIWVHWVLYNLDPKIKIINSGSQPARAMAGLTSFGAASYGGPCRPAGIHRYIFKLYALNNKLKLPPGADKESLESAMQDHVLELSQLIGLYKRK